LLAAIRFFFNWNNHIGASNARLPTAACRRLHKGRQGHPRASAAQDVPVHRKRAHRRRHSHTLRSPWGALAGVERVEHRETRTDRRMGASVDGRPGVLYVLVNPDEPGYVKIGRTVDPTRPR